MKSYVTMKRVLAIGAIFFIPLFLMSCATTSSQIAFHEVPPKDKDGSVIYVYRLPSMVGAAVPWLVRLDNKIVASLKQKAYVVLHTSPGPHIVTIGDSTPLTFTGAIAGGLVGAAIGGVMDSTVNEKLESDAKKGGTFSSASNEAYFIRSSGFSVSLVSREEALKEIVDMKFDMGM